jgi:predicted SAM-dependent methyltransferase
MTDALRINVGCGKTPVMGWRNFDNSPSLRLASAPMLAGILQTFRLLSEPQMAFIRFARENPNEYGNATKRLPVPDASADVLYSSHMLEHLDQQDALSFLREAKRVLRHGGVIRLAVPDIELKVHQYLETKDADAFIQSTLLTSQRPRTLGARLIFLFVRPSYHLWMYDGKSLSRLLESQGFANPQVVKAGETRISDPSPLDLCERAEDSVYVEAINP